MTWVREWSAPLTIGAIGLVITAITALVFGMTL